MLPVELKSRILLFLPFKYLNNAFNISREWKGIEDDLHFWKSKAQLIEKLYLETCGSKLPQISVGLQYQLKNCSNNLMKLKQFVMEEAIIATEAYEYNSIEYSQKNNENKDGNINNNNNNLLTNDNDDNENDDDDGGVIVIDENKFPYFCFGFKEESHLPMAFHSSFANLKFSQKIMFQYNYIPTYLLDVINANGETDVYVHHYLVSRGPQSTSSPDHFLFVPKSFQVQYQELVTGFYQKCDSTINLHPFIHAKLLNYLREEKLEQNLNDPGTKSILKSLAFLYYGNAFSYGYFEISSKEMKITHTSNVKFHDNTLKDLDTKWNAFLTEHCNGDKTKLLFKIRFHLYHFSHTMGSVGHSSWINLVDFAITRDTFVWNDAKYKSSFFRGRALS